MTDPLRSDRQPTAGDVPDRDRDARIEELLLDGLNYYFADQLELAINVWTRVLFLDRGHARARAYIERARSAVAERQRKGDELLHTGKAALDHGDAGAARELVTSAVDHGASSEDALALLARIDRFETALRTSASPRPDQTADQTFPATRDRAVRWKLITAGVAAGILVGAIAILVLLREGLTPWSLGATPQVTAPALLGAPLPVPSNAEIVVSRAEALFARGRLHEALSALQAVAPGDPLRARADEITAAIQKQLLSVVDAELAAPSGTASRRQ